MLQSGMSRELFERWAVDPLNGIIIAGYHVEGTLARELTKQPTEVGKALRQGGGRGGIVQVLPSSLSYVWRFRSEE